MHEDIDGKGKSAHMATRYMTSLDTELRKSHVARVLKHFKVPLSLCSATKKEAETTIRDEWKANWS